jgi:hypothetical protein
VRKLKKTVLILSSLHTHRGRIELAHIARMQRHCNIFLKSAFDAANEALLRLRTRGHHRRLMRDQAAACDAFRLKSSHFAAGRVARDRD